MESWFVTAAEQTYSIIPIDHNVIDQNVNVGD